LKEQTCAWQKGIADLVSANAFLDAS